MSSFFKLEKLDPNMVQEVLAIDLLQMSNGQKVHLLGVKSIQNSPKEYVKFLEKLLKGQKVKLMTEIKPGKNTCYAWVYLLESLQIYKDPNYTEKYIYSNFIKDGADVPSDFLVQNSEGEKVLNMNAVNRTEWEDEKYLFVNGTLIRLGFADFDPTASEKSGDDLMVYLRKKAIEDHIGIWELE